MPEILALEWDHDQISGVLAQVGSGRVRVRRSFVLGRPAVAVAGSGPLPVDWLRSQLSAHGVSGGDVLVCLPRDEAVVKRIELPETSDDELPLLVRYQAGAKSSVPLNELSLDFIPLPRRNEVPGREVLMATVPQQTITEIRTLCETAGLDLKTLGLTPAAIAELVARAEPQAGNDLAGASMVVSRHGSRLEISVLRRCHLLFSHSARLSVEDSDADPQTIVAEVSRSLVALRGAITDVKIERVWTLLDTAAHEQLADVLRKRLSCDVQRLDPLAGIEFDRSGPESAVDGAQLSGPIGLLLAQAEARVPAIDFLAPRQPPVKRDDRKRRRTIVGAGVGALVALLGFSHWLTIRGLDSEIEERQSKEATLAKEITRGKDVLASAQLIADWEKTNVPWLEELALFTERMPPTDRIYLKKLGLQPTIAAASAKSKSDVLAKVSLEGFARERNDVTRLSDKVLAADTHYRGVLPATFSPSTADSNFPWEFSTEVQIADPSAKKSDKKGAAKGAPADQDKPPPDNPPDKTSPQPEKPAPGPEKAPPAGNKEAKPEKNSAPTPVPAAPAATEKTAARAGS